MSGLLEWANAIRFTMANDPGREVLQGQLNSQGFSFLDDYLDNIFSGPSQDPIIELVKTPGRKKVASKKLKGLSVSKLRTTISLMEDSGSKGNTAPVNGFHKALLNVRAAPDATKPLMPQQIIPQQTATDDLSATPVTVSLGLQSCEPAPPTCAEQSDLSVIAEDDELPEATTSTGRTSGLQLAPSLFTPQTQSEEIVDEPIHTVTMAESSSDIFHSITLESPPRNTDERSRSPTDAERYLLPEDIEVNGVEGRAVSPKTDPLANPSEQGREYEMPLRDQDTIPSAADRFGAALFPSLPAPMPLRKSVRTPRNPSLGAGIMGAATPGAPPNGKRTSWLKKAREVKALELTLKHSSAALPPTSIPTSMPLASNGLKRKSGDIFTVSSAIADTEDEKRHCKSAKIDAMGEAPSSTTLEPPKVSPIAWEPSPPSVTREVPPQEGMLDLFKRTVEDLGARVGKGMGRTMGAVAATNALAEARAAAEARLAERHHKEEEMARTSGTIPVSPPGKVNDHLTIAAEKKSEERRLSISDLFPPMDSGMKIKDKSTKMLNTLNPEPTCSPVDSGKASNRDGPTMTSPHPPHAPRPASFVLPPPGPVFNKPSPVFVPPATSKPLLQDYGTNLTTINAFQMPAPVSLGIGSRLPTPSPPKYPKALSRQSTTQGHQPATFFDDSDTPAWMPNTQDTDYSSRYEQPHKNDPIDEDDSWPIDEKIASGAQWTFGSNVKEDSMTWSTLPSQSQRGDTGPTQSHEEKDKLDEEDASLKKDIIPGDLDVRQNIAQVDDELFEDIVLQKSMKLPQSESQTSTASLQSSQSNTGFLVQASKFIGNALGTSKKGNPEVQKVLQMAAVAAKKQQEEKDKKAARLKEMENRRQLAIQRKAEEEKARSVEHEKKNKEEGERRKREREEHTDKRPLKVVAKKDEDLTKKRKITAESTKKEPNKHPSKPILKSSSLKPPSALSSSALYNASLQTVATSSSSNPKPSKPPTPAITVQKGSGKAPNIPLMDPNDDLSQPSQIVQIQMSARAKAQLQAAHMVPEPPVASESIELPEINSEYSDSDDEDRPKSFPGWAQSPELRQALQLQSTINPDDIFGAIRPLRMEELFKTRTNRFRARTSSANWTGADRLTTEEERDYAKRMGFK